MIPGIVKVGYISADSLPDFLKPVVGNFRVNPSWIELTEPATLEEVFENNFLEYIAQTKLEFKSPEALPADLNIAFVVEDALGNQYVVGNKPPHCGKLEITSQINEPSGSASVFYYSFSIPVAKFSI